MPRKAMTLEEKAQDIRDVPVVMKFLTIKDIVEMVGYEPLDVQMQNKWVCLTFPFCTLKMRQSYAK
jgi:hypothetical protein